MGSRLSKEKQSTANYRKSKLYKQYSKRSTLWNFGYPYERDAQSDRIKGYRHIASKSLRRGLQKEAKRIIDEELNII